MSFAAYSKREFNRQTFQDYNPGGSSFSDNFYNKKHIILTIILINFKLDPVVSSTYQQIDMSV